MPRATTWDIPIALSPSVMGPHAAFAAGGRVACGRVARLPTCQPGPPDLSGRGPARNQGEGRRRMDIASIQDILPALIDALSDAVVVVDRDRQVVAANRRYRDQFGSGRPDVDD